MLAQFMSDLFAFFLCSAHNEIVTAQKLESWLLKYSALPLSMKREKKLFYLNIFVEVTNAFFLSRPEWTTR